MSLLYGVVLQVGKLLDTAVKIRELIYELIANREIETNNIWVVAGLPTKEERDRLADRLKATDIIFIEATYNQCIARAMGDTDRLDKDKQVKVIDKWFGMYNYE